jgi:pyrimidine operon attenuation protein/uracil phosphoribosyltransferase
VGRNELSLDLRGLVLVRDVLAKPGATRAEIDAHSNEIRRRQRQLADLIRGHKHFSRDPIEEAA